MKKQATRRKSIIKFSDTFFHDSEMLGSRNAKDGKSSMLNVAFSGFPPALLVNVS